MKRFTNQDVADYYDQTEVHFRIFWKLNESLGLHYGIWDKGITTLKEAILNTNKVLMEMGEVSKEHNVLDAGCGIGGSSIYIAKHTGCHVTGITLSPKQPLTATAFAKREGIADLAQFFQKDYTNTGFDANSFDRAWAMESMETATDKTFFFKEMYRVLKPGGRLLIADWFKPYPYDIITQPDMLMMSHGWAMSDILTIDEAKEIAAAHGFKLLKHRDVTKEVAPSVKALYKAYIWGSISSRLYNMYRKARFFSRNHYKTCLGQYRAYKKGLWRYDLLVFEKI